MPDFECDRCGLCCQNLKGNSLYKDLHDGDGICRYYDQESHLCTIYDRRPIKCNTKLAYIEFFSFMSYEDYLSHNYEACKILKGGK